MTEVEWKYWRIYNEEQVRHHEEINPFYHDYDVHSYVSKLEDEALAKLNERVRIVSYRDRKLVRLMKMLNDWCDRLGLDRTTCEDAARALRKLISKPVPGPREVKVVAVLYGAMVSACMPTRDLIRMALESGISEEYLKPSRLQRIARRGGLYAKCQRPELLVARWATLIARDLRLPDEVIETAHRLIALYGCSSLASSAAAAYVYIAGKLHDIYIRQEDIAAVLGITDASVRLAVKRTGVMVEYYICRDECVKVDEWHPGKDSYGMRRPYEVAYMHGVKRYTSSFKLGKPIQVYIPPVEG